MKKVKTCRAKTKVCQPNKDILRVKIPFEDGSSLNILMTPEDGIQPCTSADRFIFTSLAKDFQNDIRLLCQKQLES